MIFTCTYKKTYCKHSICTVSENFDLGHLLVVICNKCKNDGTLGSNHYLFQFFISFIRRWVLRAVMKGFIVNLSFRKEKNKSAKK